MLVINNMNLSGSILVIQSFQLPPQYIILYFFMQKSIYSISKDDIYFDSRTAFKTDTEYDVCVCV